jgi:hypothetical protein
MYRQPGGSRVREMLERGLDSERGGRLLGGRGRVGNKGLGQRARIDIPAGLYCWQLRMSKGAQEGNQSQLYQTDCGRVQLQRCEE